MPGPPIGAPVGSCINVSLEAGPEDIDREARTPTKTAARNTARIKDVFCICIFLCDFLLREVKTFNLMKDCVIVTSVVEISEAPLDWAPVRSIYSHQQRFEQTLETIDSIRKHLPGADIILAECSPESPYMEELKTRVDIFINTYPNGLIRDGYRKAVCEAQLMLYVFDRVDFSVYDNIFKISGRYVLTDKFNRSLWHESQPVGCIGHHYSTEPCIHTFFFKITNKELDILKNTFETMVTEDTTNSMEWIVYNTFKHRFKYVDEIGILARWSCFNSTPCF
jgi:hypothetical protein